MKVLRKFSNDTIKSITLTVESGMRQSTLSATARNEILGKQILIGVFCVQILPEGMSEGIWRAISGVSF